MGRIKNSNPNATAPVQIQVPMQPSREKQEQDLDSSKKSRSNSHNKINPTKDQEEPTTHLKTTAGVFSNNKLFLLLFYLHLFLTAILVTFLTIRGLVAATTSTSTHHFHPLRWYPPLLTSSACAAIIAFSCQWATKQNPSKTLRASLWLSPSLTCAAGILFLSIGTAGSFAAAAIALVCALIQSLYVCWFLPRLVHATKILSVSLSAPAPGATKLVTLSLLIGTLYSCFSVSGIGGATATKTRFDPLLIFVILLSLAWTMHVIRNALHVAISRVSYIYFTQGIEVGTRVDFSLMGSVCLGSILEPILGFCWRSARAMNAVAGDTDEFLFSCANCYSGVAERIVAYGNRWGFVHVGVYSKGFVRACVDTWDMFGRVGMKSLIDSDITEFFFFLCGSAGGSLCALVGGPWALAINKHYATEICIYAFFIGYFMTQAAMSWPQACVSAYHVAYAENPHSLQFDSTIPNRIQELQRYQAD